MCVCVCVCVCVLLVQFTFVLVRAYFCARKPHNWIFKMPKTWKLKRSWWSHLLLWQWIHEHDSLQEWAWGSYPVLVEQSGFGLFSWHGVLSRVHWTQRGTLLCSVPCLFRILSKGKRLVNWSALIRNMAFTGHWSERVGFLCLLRRGCYPLLAEQTQTLVVQHVVKKFLRIILHFTTCVWTLQGALLCSDWVFVVQFLHCSPCVWKLQGAMLCSDWLFAYNVVFYSLCLNAPGRPPPTSFLGVVDYKKSLNFIGNLNEF